MHREGYGSLSLCECVCHCVYLSVTTLAASKFISKLRYYRVLNGILTHIFCQNGFFSTEIWHYLLAMTILIAFSQQKTHPTILDKTGNDIVCEALATANDY